MRRQAAQGRGEGRGRWSGAGARERRSTNAVRRARRLAAESGLRALMANLAGDGIGTAFASCGEKGFTPCAGKWERRWAAGALRTAFLLLRNGRWAGCFWQGSPAKLWSRPRGYPWALWSCVRQWALVAFVARKCSWSCPSFFLSHSLHTYTHVRIRTHAKKILGGASPPIRGKRTVPPNAHVCVYPKISGKTPEKGTITRI
jgi:hypothetical protein